MPRFSFLVGLWMLLMVLSGEAQQVERWGRFETSIENARTYGSPYKDVTLNVTYQSPAGAEVRFLGFYDGGQTWKIRFMPDQVGTWTYVATFSDGAPGKTGAFECVASQRPGTIGAYAANPRWFGHKGGNAKLIRSFHAASLFKFSIDDPENPNDGERRKLFLDWAQGQGYNTFSALSHFSTSDSAGPKLWPLNPATYRKVEMILDDLSERKMMVYGFGGFFARSGDFPSSSSDRTLYIRYCLARFAPYWNEIWNVGGPEPNLGGYLSASTVRQLGAEIAASDPFGHLVGVHNRDGSDPYRNDEWCSYITLQEEITSLSTLSAYLHSNSVAGKPVYAQETLWMGNTLQPDWSLTDLRKHLWVHMMAAASYNAGDMRGNNESGFGGSLNLADKIQERHDVPKMVWDFMETVPFQNMAPRQDLRNSGYLLADVGKTYLCYLPTGGSVNIAVSAEGGPYAVKWINARNPLGDQRVAVDTADGTGLTAPDGDDWLVYLVGKGDGGGDPPTGLNGEYFNNPDFSDARLSRTDPTINFDWGSGSPDASVGVDTFSIRWDGTVRPAHAAGDQTYTFYTSTNDGVRLWVDHQLIIDDWTDGALRERSGTISLTAGKRHPIRMEFYEATGDAQAELRWESAGISKQIIATVHLAPHENLPPTAAADSASTEVELPVIIPVLENDLDPDHLPSPITLQSVHSATPGATVRVDGDLAAYDPPPGFTGTDTFTYLVSDGESSSLGNVSVTVSPWTTFEFFLRRYFDDEEQADPAISGWQADPDRDGVSNGIEYSQFSDPTQANSLPKVDAKLRTGFLILTFNKRKAATDFTGIPEVSDDLGLWKSGADFVEETMIAEDPLKQVIEARSIAPVIGTDRQFMRLRLER